MGITVIVSNDGVVTKTEAMRKLEWDCTGASRSARREVPPKSA